MDYIGSEAMAARIQNKKELSVVVIGGGLGGLSAAAHLSRQGLQVTLVEQHEFPGGYATTFDRAGGKYTFDVSLHVTGSTREEGMLRSALEGAGILDQVETVELPEICRIITPDHDLIWPRGDPDQVVEQLVQIFPSEAQGIRGFFAEIMVILAEAMKSLDRHSSWAKILFPLARRKMWSIRKQTLAEQLDRYVQDEKARFFLSIFWPFFGLPPSRLSGFYYSIALASILRYGCHCIKHRSQDLSNALMGAIEAAGGTVLFKTEAAGITLKNGVVTGVELRDGRHLDAHAVISNASVPATMEMVLRDSRSGDHSRKVRKYLSKIKSYRPSISTFVVWLGLSREIRGKVQGYEIFVRRDYDPEAGYRARLACDSMESSFNVTIHDNAYGGYSRPGTSTVTITTLSGYEPWRSFEADYIAGRKEAYLKKKEQIARRLIGETEKLVIPGLTSMIEVMDAATPLTNVRYTKNPEGAIYGYEQSVDNSFMTRLGNRTPFKGLYLASAWSHPGGGFEPCLFSGVEAFRALARDMAKKRGHW